MEKVQYCAALPGCCWMCRSSNREWYVDTQQSIDFYGAVYLCNECIIEMSRLAGMFTVEDVEEFQNRIAFFEDENYHLRVRVSGLEQAIDGLRLAGSVPGISSISDAPVPISPTAETTSVGEESMEHEGRVTPESSNDEGVGELRSNESSSSGESTFSLNL